MAIDPRISLGVQPIQIENPLTQYGQMQNILAAQAQQQAAGTQNELAQETLARTRLENQDIQQARDVVDQIMIAAKKNGAPTDDPFAAGMQMLQHPNPKVQVIGQHLVDATQKILAYQQDQSFINRGNTPGAAPAAAAIPKTFTPGALGSGTFDANAPTNQLAPAPAVAPAAAPPVNQLAAQPQTSRADQLLAEIRDLRTRFPYSSKAKDEIALLTKQWEEASKPHVVGRNLVTGSGESIFTAPQDVTPSEVGKLIAERNALITKNPADPNIAIYDKQIKDINLARERLNFDQQKFAWEKANPGYTIQQTEDGSIVGVNNRSLQAFPVTLNGVSAPPAAPFTPGQPSGTTAPAPGGAGKRGAVAAPGAQPIIQPRGEPLKGKSSGLTESQGNATAFGMRMKDSHTVLKNLENKGETNTGLVRGAVGGTVGLVPLIGDKLSGATDNVFNILPTVLGGMSPEQQQIQNSRINFITAVLRKESGASIAPSEFATAEKLYFPKPGDDISVIRQKQKARETAIKAMEIQAGPGAKSIQSTTPSTPGATSASDPLGLFTK